MSEIQGERGYFKVYRSMLTDWGWFTNPNTAHLWIYILGRANDTPSTFKGMRIGRGELLESQAEMCRKTGLSRQELRTSLSHLISTKEITMKPTKFGMRIKVLNYALYQGSSDNDQPTI